MSPRTTGEIVLSMAEFILLAAGMGALLAIALR